MSSTLLVDEVVSPVSGGSQASLVRSKSDSYIVKCPYNTQGPNVLANEFLGAELMSALGLPMPKWKFARFRESHACPHCARSNLDSTRQPLHFASSLLGPTIDAQAASLMPLSFVPHIRNRSDFLRAWIFDLWAGSTDRRQALLLGDNGMYKAIFIDNGHLFGGPNWNGTARRGVALSRHLNLYNGIITADNIECALYDMERLIPKALSASLTSMPTEWAPTGSIALEEALLVRLNKLRSIVLREIGTTFSAWGTSQRNTYA